MCAYSNDAKWTQKIVCADLAGGGGAKVGVSMYAILKEVLNKCKRKGNTGSSSVNMLCRTVRPAGQLTGDGATQNHLQSNIVRQNADFSSLYEALKDTPSTYILSFFSKRANGPIHSALEQVSITKNMLLGLMAPLLLKSVCEKLHTQDKTLVSEITVSVSGLDGSALVNRLLGLLWWLRCLLTFCHMRTLCPFLLKDAVFKMPSWEKYWFFTSAATFIRMFCLKTLKRAFSSFGSHSAPGTLWQKHKGTLRYSLSTVTVVMSGLNSANTLLSHLQLRKEGSQSSYG